MRQELKERHWRNVAYRPASHYLLSLLSLTAQDHLPRSTTTHRWALPNQLLIKKLLFRLPYRPVHWEAFFFSTDSFIPGDPTLCQVEKKNYPGHHDCKNSCLGFYHGCHVCPVDFRLNNDCNINCCVNSRLPVYSIDLNLLLQ